MAEVGGVAEESDAVGLTVDGGLVVRPGGGLAPDGFGSGEALGIGDEGAAILTELFAEAEAEAAVIGIAEGEGLGALEMEREIDGALGGGLVEGPGGGEGGEGRLVALDERVLGLEVNSLCGAAGEDFLRADEAGGTFDFAPEVFAVDDAVAPPKAAMPGVVLVVAGAGVDGPTAGEFDAIGGEEWIEEGLVPLGAGVEGGDGLTGEGDGGEAGLLRELPRGGQGGGGEGGGGQEEGASEHDPHMMKHLDGRCDGIGRHRRGEMGS